MAGNPKAESRWEWIMLVPQVSAQLMLLTYAVTTKSGQKRDTINAMLQEHPTIEFDAIYPAVQRLYAFASALRTSEAFNPWGIPPAPGEIYNQISPSLWEAVATARLEASDDPEAAYMLAQFQMEDLQKSIRPEYTA